MTVDAVQLAQDLIRIDSRNSAPMDRAGPREADEEGMAAFLEAWFTQRGLTVTRQYAAPRRPNLIAATDRNSSAPTLAFQAHMDTVGTHGMTIEPFDPCIHDGNLYGRGACDTKGGMAAMLAAMDRLLADRAPINLLFIATCAEETGCEGSPHMDLGQWPVDGIVVGEPTGNRMVVAHKANGCFELLCTGRAAHGARPETGCNAIYRTVDLIGFLRETVMPELQAHEGAGFTGSTLSVNMIDGGAKSNIVPDRCTAVVDLRVVPGHGEPADVMAALLERASQKLGFDVSVLWSHCTPGLLTDTDCLLCRAARAGLTQCGADPTPGTVSYCTDGGVFSHMGYDSVVLGPGDIRQAHCAVEYISVAQLREAVDIYTAIAHAMIGHAQHR